MNADTIPAADTAAAVADGLAAVRREIAAAVADCGRDPASVSLVAVSKTHGEAAVRAALAAGQTVFGENKVQEAKAKFAGLRTEFPNLRLHLVGPLQTNKVKDAVATFDVIESLDRPKLAQALADEMAVASRRPELLVQVNTGEEPQKAGVPPLEADAFIDDCVKRLGLPVVGLMCVPPVDEEPAMHFALLREIAKRHGLTRLSMGMSGDFPTAIRFGATHVRVGTAIFGAR